MRSIIEINDLYYEYEGSDTPAVRGVTLEVREGEFVAIIGHNGSGKSTLAKLINGLYTPTSGTVLVDGMDTADEKSTLNIRRTAGMVFQNPDNQMVASIVEEDVAFGPENLGVPTEELRGRVDDALSAVGMLDHAGSMPHKLSGGQKQRVAIAGVIAMRPKIIILDEPTAMLDPSGRQEVMETVHRLNREEGITVLHITHFMNEAAGADRVFVMDDGRFVLSGTPAEVFSDREKLRDMGLDIPRIAEIADKLRAKGVPLSDNIIEQEQLVEELCRLLPKT